MGAELRAAVIIHSILVQEIAISILAEIIEVRRKAETLKNASR